MIFGAVWWQSSLHHHSVLSAFHYSLQGETTIEDYQDVWNRRISLVKSIKRHYNKIKNRRNHFIDPFLKGLKNEIFFVELFFTINMGGWLRKMTEIFGPEVHNCIAKIMVLGCLRKRLLEFRESRNFVRKWSYFRDISSDFVYFRITFYTTFSYNASNHSLYRMKLVIKRQLSHRVHILVEMKQGQCICPLSWSVHCNFTGEGKCNERGWACTPTLTSQDWFYPHHWMYARKQRLQLCVLCELSWGKLRQEPATRWFD